MLRSLLPSALAALAGASIVVQQGLNANLRAALRSAAWSGVVSYLVGFVCMAVFAVALRDPLPAAGFAQRLPWWTWSGGLFGAIYIGLSIVLVPQLGAATFVALLVAGQMATSVAMDHGGLLGLTQRPVDAARFLGMTLIVGGVVLIRR